MSDEREKKLDRGDEQPSVESIEEAAEWLGADLASCDGVFCMLDEEWLRIYHGSLSRSVRVRRSPPVDEWFHRVKAEYEEGRVPCPDIP